MRLITGKPSCDSTTKANNAAYSTLVLVLHSYVIAYTVIQWNGISWDNVSITPRLHDRANIEQTSSWLVQLTRASSSSQLHRVSGVLPTGAIMREQPNDSRPHVRLSTSVVFKCRLNQCLHGVFKVVLHTLIEYSKPYFSIHLFCDFLVSLVIFYYSVWSVISTHKLTPLKRDD